MQENTITENGKEGPNYVVIEMKPTVKGTSHDADKEFPEINRRKRERKNTRPKDVRR